MNARISAEKQNNAAKYDLFTKRAAVALAVGEIKTELSKEEENILAQLSEVTDAPDSIYTMLSNADMKFVTIKDEDGDGVYECSINGIVNND